MIILGLYCGHDGNVAIVRDGEVLYHAEIERTARRHHEGGFRLDVLNRGLSRFGLTLADVDAIAIGGGNLFCPWGPAVGGEDIYAPIMAAAKAAAGTTSIMSEVYTDDPMSGVGQGEVSLQGRAIPLYVVAHHLSHAALSYYTSPFPSATLVSWDNGGDSAFGLIARGKDGVISDVMVNPPHGGKPKFSVGGAWTAISVAYELNNKTDPEGKVMGLAAYGQATEEYKRRVREYMAAYWTDQGALPIAGRFDDIDWDPRSPSAQSLAASLQAVTEEVMGEIVALYAAPGSAVCLSGGCAYNCVANGVLGQRYDVHVTNCPHDGGLGLGAALFVWHHAMGNAFSGVPEFSPYQGEGDEIAISDDAILRAVEDLRFGRVVAWYAGRSEAGKRALGNRSILLDPRIRDGKQRINEQVKRREWFRPFAPSVLAGHTDWCNGPVPRSPYMNASCSVAEDWRDKVPAVVHVDGTCRPQIVTPTINPTYHRLLSAFHDASGVPMLLNTSFNVREPIVDTPEHAIATFRRTAIDVLYLDGLRITKD